MDWLLSQPRWEVWTTFDKRIAIRVGSVAGGDLVSSEGASFGEALDAAYVKGTQQQRMRGAA